MKRFLNEPIPMNLQFFAEDGEGVTESEPAEQTTEAEATGETEGVTEEAAEPQFQTEKANAAFASMRREVEAARRQQAEIDSLYAKQFGQYTNPETGEPIRTARDYAEAMAAQERMQAREKLRENNIDPSLVDNLIANSPAVKAAEAATAELNDLKAQQKLEKDIKAILILDPSVQSADDIYAAENFPAIVERVRAGYDLVDAYKLENFDRLSGAKGEAAKQAALNSVKAKNHLTTGASINVGDTGEDIPADQIELYKEAFPDKSMSELKALYNKARGARR